MVQRVNNFFLIAGEKSGDLYGSKLIEELLNINPKVIIVNGIINTSKAPPITPTGDMLNFLK